MFANFLQNSMTCHGFDTRRSCKACPTILIRSFMCGISGHNGTIDGQGKMWWELWWNRTLEYTRGHLLELMNSNNILISNLTFLNSPFWTVHPVYCRCVLIFPNILFPLFIYLFLFSSIHA